MLRDEVRARRPPSGVRTKTALRSLMRVDSSIRESQRLSNFHTTLIQRVVTAPAGLRLPDGPRKLLPRGIYPTVNLDGTHHDDALFAAAHAYDPLRFTRVRERWDARPDAERGGSAW